MSKEKKKKKHSLSFSSFLSYVVSGSLILFASFFIYKSIQNNHENHDPILIENVCKKAEISFTNTNNILCFTSNVIANHENMEFPSIHHSDLFQIHVISNDINVSYKPKSFQRISGNYPSTSFCVDHQFPGIYNISISCNFDNIFHENYVYIKTVNSSLKWEGISRMTDNGDEMLVLTDFCVNMHDDVIFLSNNDVQISPVPISLDNEISFWVMPPNTQTRKFPIEEYTTLFITLNGDEPWIKILGTYLPIFRNNIYKNIIGVKYRRINMGTDEIETIKRIIPDNKILYKDRCYHMGVFPKGCLSRNKNEFAYLFQQMKTATKGELEAFRDAMTKSSFKKRKIVIDRQFAKDCPDIFNIINNIIQIIMINRI